MPIYEYYCPQCERDFEVIRPVSRSDVARGLLGVRQSSRTAAIQLRIQVQHLYRA